jgi:hypothetical protein
LEAVFLLGVWQGFCKSQWRSTWKSPAKGPLRWTLHVGERPRCMHALHVQRDNVTTWSD